MAQSPDILTIDLGFANLPGKDFGTIAFADLIDDDSRALADLDESFLVFLASDPAMALLGTQLVANRAASNDDDSYLLVELGKALEQFLMLAFNLDTKAHQSNHLDQSQLLKLKWKFVKRQGVLHHSLFSLEDFDALDAEQALGLAMIASDLAPEMTKEGGFTDASFGKSILHWQNTKDTQSLALAARYAAWAAQTADGALKYRDSVLFKVPGEHSETKWLSGFTKEHKVFKIKPMLAHERIGFDLTEPAVERKQAHLQSLDQADYCLKCHKTKTDSCSKGRDTQHSGCPLHEKISEFMQLRSEGFTLGALAMIVRDNPMLAATGHRICNDCSQACVFQNQTPVDIPKAETQILREVLEWSLGFEIYALLTRWNPLNIKLGQPQKQKPQSLLVAGMGPAGFTLAHHMLQRGYHVAGIDALKLQALPKDLAHKLDAGLPITDITQAFEPLGERPAFGFGGVAEYGITSRWEKNYLTVIRLLLLRRKRFKEFGDIRLGSSLTVGRAFEWGFSHVACALGAGAPKVPELKSSTENALPRGVKTASDFLMALHSAGARKSNANANLQIRMPIVVIGGGLTAVDAATEALAYYPVQVERYARRFADMNPAQVDLFLAQLNAEDLQIHKEFLEHALAFSERPASDVLNELGGGTLIYRRGLLQSPAFRLNRDELTKALAEGIKIVEHTSPLSYSLDSWQAVKAIELHADDGLMTLACRTVLYAIGTQANDIIFNEDTTFRKQPVGFQLGTIADGRWISRLGDLHPDYMGSVVKAMASAKAAAPLIDEAIQAWSSAKAANSLPPRFEQLTHRLALEHSAVITRVVKHGANITEIFVHAPAAAQRFAPGQFFRLQSLTDDSIEPLAMTGASVDAENGEISMVILSMGTSSQRSTQWQVGAQISLMGPTGAPTLIPSNRKVVLVGGGLGNAVLFSIGKAMRSAGCEVIYFAAYKTQGDIFTAERIQAAAQTVVWCCDQQLPVVHEAEHHSNDQFFHGNVVAAINNYQHLLVGADHLLVIGSDRMMAAVAAARLSFPDSALSKIPVAIASINSPMQCMMKAVCGQCLQLQRNKDTGAVSYVFSCLAQDQPLDLVDFSSLSQRLHQNRLLETMSFVAEKSND